MTPVSHFKAKTADAKKYTTPIETKQALRLAKMDHMSQLKYAPLDEETTHIRVYSDESFQNLELKHSQIGFIIVLADKNHKFNLIHWHSSRSPRRPHSTEESEMMALDVALRSLKILRMIIFQLLKKEVPIFAYCRNRELRQTE